GARWHCLAYPLGSVAYEKPATARGMARARRRLAAESVLACPSRTRDAASLRRHHGQDASIPPRKLPIPNLPARPPEIPPLRHTPLRELPRPVEPVDEALDGLLAGRRPGRFTTWIIRNHIHAALDRPQIFDQLQRVLVRIIHAGDEHVFNHDELAVP